MGFDLVGRCVGLLPISSMRPVNMAAGGGDARLSLGFDGLG